MRLLVLALLAVLLVGAPSAGATVSDPVGVWPLQPAPEVVAGFDPPDAPWGSGHRGVDLLGIPGQAVHAALAGRVTYAGLLAGRGVLVVDHGETRTTYEPVVAMVQVGDDVAQGAVLGRLVGAGSHCPPRACLHWGWRRGEVYLDPLGLVGASAVRLLPLWRDEPLPLPDSAPAAATPGAPTAALWAPTLPYAAVLARLAWRFGRSPPYARGCACW